MAFESYELSLLGKSYYGFCSAVLERESQCLEKQWEVYTWGCGKDDRMLIPVNGST